LGNFEADHLFTRKTTTYSSKRKLQREEGFLDATTGNTGVLLFFRERKEGKLERKTLREMERFKERGRSASVIGAW